MRKPTVRHREIRGQVRGIRKNPEIDAQSIVVSAATQHPGQEGAILRFVFWHSLVLAVLMGLLVLGQANLWTWMIP